MPQAPNTRPPAAADYQALASFRHALRHFLDFSARAARQVGLTTQHYQALLALKAADNAPPLTVGQLADELLLRHHSAVELIDRLEARELVRRIPSTRDRRVVQVRLSGRGEAMIARLAATHREELRRVGRKIRESLGRIVPKNTR